ncbi:37S ribosomal protein RSM18 like [Verticillium longisporum]|nr:37S ribosomal protein RSM18 like [Verticillium longisporum]
MPPRLSFLPAVTAPSAFLRRLARPLSTTPALSRTEAQLARKRFELQQLRERKTSDDYMKQMPRKWKTGDVYAPHDMNPHQLARWKKKTAPKRDVTDLLSLNPLDMYKNFSMISEYMTSFGQIKNSRDTGLRPRNQRRMAKAIRRVIGMGIHPSVHFHPEIIMKRLQGGRKLQE